VAAATSEALEEAGAALVVDDAATLLENML